MTNQTDIDALIAKAMAVNSALLVGAPAHAADVFLTDADEEWYAAAQPQTILALLAELRQERERAEEASHAAGRHKSDAALYEAELARAQEVIEKAKAEAQRIMDADDLTVWASHAGYRAANRIRGVLATYEEGQQS